METIEAGIVKDILNKLGKFISDIFDYAMEKYPDNIKNIKVDANGIITLEVSYGGGSVVAVTMKPTKNNEKLYEVTMKPISGPAKESRAREYHNKVEYKDNESLIRMLTAYGETFNPAESLEDIPENVFDSTIVKLNKITSSKDISIGIKQIIMGTNLLPVPTMSNINTVLDNDEFIASLPEGDSFIEISDAGDNLETTVLENYTCDDCTTRANSILYCISKCYATQLYLFAIQTNVVGEGIDKIYQLLDGCPYSINDAIRTLFDIYRHQNPPAFISMSDITNDVCECMTYDIGCNISVSEAKDLIYTIYSDYLASLEIMQYNLSDLDFNTLTYVMQSTRDFISCLQREMYVTEPEIL